MGGRSTSPVLASAGDPHRVRPKKPRTQQTIWLEDSLGLVVVPTGVGTEPDLAQQVVVLSTRRLSERIVRTGAPQVRPSPITGLPSRSPIFRPPWPVREFTEGPGDRPSAAADALLATAFLSGLPEQQRTDPTVQATGIFDSAATQLVTGQGPHATVNLAGTLPIATGDATVIPSGAAPHVRYPKDAERCGRYILKKFHAKGGMGEIWMAEDPVIGRPVALKRMLTQRPEHAQRFFVEAQVTGQLEHPGIVPVHELGVNELGQPFYTMKFVRGRTLQKVLAEFHDKKDKGGDREVERYGCSRSSSRSARRWPTPTAWGCSTAT